MLNRSLAKGERLLAAAILGFAALAAPALPAAAQAPSPHIVFQNATNGLLVDWKMSGTNLANYSYLQSPGSTDWKPVGSGDFTGDGNPDILLQSQSTGQIIYWQMVGTAFQQFGYISPSSPGSADWKVVGVADLDGDGKSDILLQNKTTGQIVYWLMNGFTLNRFGSLPDPGSTAWKVVGTADLNGDGSADIILQNQQTGSLVYWIMNGVSFVRYGLLTDPGTADWQVVGVGDFTGDGLADILFQNRGTGQLVYWEMNGTTFVRYGYINPSYPGALDWHVTILWQPTNGPRNYQ